MSNALPGGKLPHDVLSLVAWLDKINPPPSVSLSQLSTETGRLQVAHRLGRRELIDNLKDRLEREQRDDEH